MGLLGAPDDVYGPDERQNAFHSGLLGMAMGLLNAGQPSRIPVGIGSAFGQGLQGFGQAQGQALMGGLQAQKAKTDLEREQLALQADRNWAGMAGPTSVAGTPQPNGEMVAPAGATQMPGGSPMAMPGVPPGILKIASTMSREKGGAFLGQYMMRDDDPNKQFKFESGNIYDLKKIDANGSPALVGTYSQQAPWQYQADTKGGVGVRPGVLGAQGQVEYSKSFNEEMGKAPWKVIPIWPGGGAFQPFPNVKPPSGFTADGGAGGEGGGGSSADVAKPMPGTGGKMLIAPSKNPPGTQENKFSEEYGGGLGKKAIGDLDAADKARDQLANTQMMRGLAQVWTENGGSQNWTAPLQSKFTAIAQGMGVDPNSLGLPKDAGPAQAFDALMRKAALGNIGSGGMPANNFSEADRGFIVDMQPRLADTPAGFEAKMMISEKVAQRAIEKEAMWNQYEDAGKSYQQFRRDWSKHVTATPIFTEDDRKKLNSMIAPAKGGPLQGDDAALVNKYLKK